MGQQRATNLLFYLKSLECCKATPAAYLQFCQFNATEKVFGLEWKFLNIIMTRNVFKR